MTIRNGLTALACAATLFLPSFARPEAPEKTSTTIDLKSSREVSAQKEEFLPEVRALYVPGWRAISKGSIDAYIETAERLNINTLMIDVKNANGEVFLPYAPEWARAKTAEGYKRSINIAYIREQAPELRLIARHVMFRDKALYDHNPELQMMQKGNEFWVDMRKQEVLEYNFQMLSNLGMFDEVVLDYIRFPATQQFGTDEEKCDVIDAVVAEAARSSPVPLGVQVFGYAAWHYKKAGVGQRIQTLAEHADVIWPMIYPSHFWKPSFGYADPSQHPYEFITMGYEAAIKTLGVNEHKTEIRPMLQAFRYGNEEMFAELKATRDSNMPGYAWWSPSGTYKLVPTVHEPFFDTEIAVAKKESSSEKLVD